MQYHLETIPVWDALKADTACPFCFLYDKNENNQIEYTLGGSVMEPDERIRVNATGFCQRHQKMIYDRKNRLGHALMLESHAIEVLEKLGKAESKFAKSAGKGGLFKKEDPLEDLTRLLDGLSAGCVVCSNINAVMDRYLYTFVHLWKSDQEFRTALENSRGLCIPHTSALLNSARQHLHGESRDKFAAWLMQTLIKKLENDQKDLQWFIKKFDYRFSQEPWGNSRDSVERMVNRLRSRCVGDAPAQASS